ncbi:MAG: hypothetical protein IK062_08675 [Selenomonadaceae bacterium]|nr:hypothetical protein [Selenomonadaceae bacterium]
MSSAVLSVNFAFADASYRTYSMGTFAVNSVAVTQFKNRLRTFNTVDETTQKKFTNLADVLKSDSGAALSGIKSASITTSNITRIYDAATYRQ